MSEVGKGILTVSENGIQPVGVDAQNVTLINGAGFVIKLVYAKERMHCGKTEALCRQAWETAM